MSHSIITLTAEEKEQVALNIDYAKGLYELYPIDADVQTAMRQKGLSESVIYEINRQIKLVALQTRLHQAKMHMIYGGALFVGFFIIKFLLGHIPGADRLLLGEQAGEGMLRFMFRFYAEIFYFLMFLGMLRTFVGFLAFRRYKRLLAED